jgi:hypothetical protein
MRNSRQLCPVQIVIKQKPLENEGYFNCLGSVIASGARCTREIKFRITMAIAAFSKKKNVFCRFITLKFKQESNECCVWSIALNCAEACTLQKTGQKYVESFAMWCWRRMEKISWTYCVRNKAA